MMNNIYESFNLLFCLIGLIIGTILPYIAVNFLEKDEKGKILKSRRNVVIHIFICVWTILFAWFLSNLMSIIITGQTTFSLLKNILQNGFSNVTEIRGAFGSY